MKLILESKILIAELSVNDKFFTLYNAYFTKKSDNLKKILILYYYFAIQGVKVLVSTI